MATHKTSDFEKALLKKGFKNSNSHHKMFRFYLDGRMTDIITYISHGEKEFGENILSLRRKQMKLENKEQLSDIIDCCFSEEDYRRWVTENYGEK